MKGSGPAGGGRSIACKPAFRLCWRSRTRRTPALPARARASPIERLGRLSATTVGLGSATTATVALAPLAPRQ